MRVARALLCGTILFACGGANAPRPASSIQQPWRPAVAEGVRVSRYNVRLNVDIENREVQGVSLLSIQSPAHHAVVLILDRGELDVQAVVQRVHGLPDVVLKYRTLAAKLEIEVPQRDASDPSTTIRIVYVGRPSTGIEFNPTERQVFTAFATSQWMPCIDSPSVRASLRLVLQTPATLKVVGNGTLLSEQIEGERKTSIWELAAPTPSYLYGFVVGPFREWLESSSVKPKLRVLVPQTFSESEAAKIFESTRSMVSFYENASGLPYPYASYTQVLVRGSAAQEMASFSVMGERYGQRVLEDPKRIWLGAHELAHQWWGNEITNRDWREMWLNEGIATLMNVAFLEQQFGRESYDEHIAKSLESYNRIREAKHDKALVFASWDSPSSDDRALVYDKGSYVVYLLRMQLGEEAFWRGIRMYSQRNVGKSVSTGDFQTAMESASGKSLDAFFETWVRRVH
jgi:aminopeptidase N